MAAAASIARKNSKQESSHAQSAANQSTSSFGNFPSKKPAFSLLWRTAREFLLIFLMGVWTCLVAWDFRRLAVSSSVLTILVLVAGPKVPVPTYFLDGSAEVKGVLFITCRNAPRIISRLVAILALTLSYITVKRRAHTQNRDQAHCATNGPARTTPDSR